MKYSVGGKPFRFLCDAEEWSWQLCRKWADDYGGDLVIKPIDSISYGVFDQELRQFIHSERVERLT